MFVSISQPIVRADATVLKRVKESSTNRKPADVRPSKENGSSTVKPATKSVATKPTVGKPAAEKGVSRSEESVVKTRTAVVKAGVKQVARSDPPKIVMKRTTSVTSTRPELRRVDSRETGGRVTRTTGPLKASHAVKIAPRTNPPPSNVVKSIATGTAVASVSVPAKNVMNQVHNVTVSSPPPVRKDYSEAEAGASTEPEHPVPIMARDRTRTRTLEKDEIVFLKKEPTRTVLKPETAAGPMPAETVSVEVKQPISFEVNFDGAKNAKPDVLDTKYNTAPDMVPPDVDEVEDNYEDDFDSYESDFESAPESSSESESGGSASESSTPSGSSSAMAESSDADTTSDVDEQMQSAQQENSAEHIAERRPEEERQLDSGAFDLKPPDPAYGFQVGPTKSNADDNNHLYEERDMSSEAQNDSGIEYNINIKSPKSASKSDQDRTPSTSIVIGDTTTNHHQSNRPIRKSPFYRRGEEIMKKITFDTMNFVLFDFKPIAYEQFMMLYGNSNGVQVSAQTHNNLVNQESQTDSSSSKTMWTQCPINYTVSHIQSADFADYKRGFGRELDHHGAEKSGRDLNNTIQTLNRFELKPELRRDEVAELHIDHAHLNRFLKEALITISNIIAHESTSEWLKTSSISFSDGWLPLDLVADNVWREQQITGIHSQSNLPNLLFTLHAGAPNRLNFIAVWNVWNVREPVCLLSSWSRIGCCEIHANLNGVVVAGLADG